MWLLWQRLLGVNIFNIITIIRQKLESSLFKALRLYSWEDAKLKWKVREKGGREAKRKKEGREPHFEHPISKTPVIWALPSHITLAIWVRVKVKVYTGQCLYHWGFGNMNGDAQNAGMPISLGHRLLSFPQFPPVLFSQSPRTGLSPSLEQAKGTG